MTAFIIFLFILAGSCYFENPSDKDLKKLAFSEILAYQKSFLSKLTFVINDKDLLYYSNNEYLYTLDKKKFYK